ncbi:MAG: hypothetical protein IT558_03490 [Alphaproteobacteria bacterium]|nr:hypothetical protein [Alphaproteobacteria bacterium]
MPTLMPLDSDNNPIPALRIRSGAGGHSITASGSSARNSTAFNADTRVVSVYATVPVYINFGDSSVTAASTSHYFPSGLYYDFAIGGGQTGHFTHLAVLQVSSGGTVYISEKE